MNIEQVRHELLCQAIPCTFEYPGYVSIWYRNINVVLGIESNELLIQIDDEGISVPNEYDSIINITSTAVVSDILSQLKSMLINAYIEVDEYLLNKGE